MKIDPIIKKELGFTEKESERTILKIIREKKTIACKPCWELKYCPYGPLVEDFPLFPPDRDEAIEHNEYLKKCLKTKILGDGRKLDNVLAP
jgi:hypothetical protein